MIVRPNNRKSWTRPSTLCILVLVLLTMTSAVRAQPDAAPKGASTSSTSSSTSSSISSVADHTRDVSTSPASSAAASSTSPASTSTASSQNGTSTSCHFTNCVTICNPSCADGTSCTLSSPTQCGVCPKAICIDLASIGLPSSSNSSNNNSNSAMLPGLIGGLGGVLVLAIGGFVFYRHRKQGAMGQTFFGKPKGKQLGSQDDMRSWGNGTSAVIPIAFIPPGQNGQGALSPSQSALRLSLGFSSSASSIAPLPAAATGLSLGFQKSYDPRNSTRSENPFDDLEDEEAVQVKTAVSKTVMTMGSTTTLPTFDASLSVSTFNLGSPAATDGYSNRLTVDSEFFGSEGDRDSIATVNMPTAPVIATQAVQVLRAKPQMMRINTIRSPDTSNRVSRSGSVRTVMSTATSGDGHTAIDMDPNFSPDMSIFTPSVPMEFRPEVLNVISPKDNEASSSTPQQQAPAPAGGMSVVKVTATIAEESDDSDDEDLHNNNAARNESPFDNRHSVVDDEEEEDTASAHNAAIQAQQSPMTLAGPVDASRLSAILPGGNSSDRSASMMTARTNRTNTTDSVMSSLGDGEITIMWGGYRNSEVPEGEGTAGHEENQGDILEMMMDDANGEAEEGQGENKDDEEEESEEEA